MSLEITEPRDFFLNFLQDRKKCIKSFLLKRTTCLSIYRKIGETLYKPYTQSNIHNHIDCKEEDADEESSSEDSLEDNSNRLINKRIFIQSDNSQIRILSSLIILRTLNQIDIIVNTLELLKKDLKNNLNNKEYFLKLNGVWTLLKWCKLNNNYKIVLMHLFDLYLLLSIDNNNDNNQLFIQQCSNETWFSHISILFKTLSINYTQNELILIEKLSILLQKLSQISSNKRFFDMFSYQVIIYDLINKLNLNDNNFLLMNLKSILLKIKR